MNETFLALLTAHLVADFPLQPDWMIKHKRNPAMLGLHAAVVGLTAIVALGAFPWPVLLILLPTHLAMDAIKVYGLKDTLQAFILDQLVHILVIGGLALIYPQSFADGWGGRLAAAWRSGYCVALCLVAGLIAALPAGAILIRKATADFTRQIADDISGLDNGGVYIGGLERALVMLLMLMGQPAGVGFLITAKSILRFGDVKDSGQRKLTEYIIIGTFMSFGWGLLIAALTQLGVQHWLGAGPKTG